MDQIRRVNGFYWREGNAIFNIVAATNENMVITEHEPVKARSDTYQSEAEIEKEFIRMLTEQGHTYLNIHT